jgi:hypothetical protein
MSYLMLANMEGTACVFKCGCPGFQPSIVLLLNTNFVRIGNIFVHLICCQALPYKENP